MAYKYSAGTILMTISGRTFRVINNSNAYVGIITGMKGTYTGPLLVSDIASEVTYGTSYDSNTFTYLGTVTYNDVTYYYSSDQYFFADGATIDNPYNFKKYNYSSMADAALALLADNIIEVSTGGGQ